MNSFHHFVQARGGFLGSTTARNSRRAIVVRRGAGTSIRRFACRLLALPLVLLAGCLGWTGAAHAQTVPDASAGGFRLSGGGAVSAYDLDYGDVKKMGASVFVDFDTLHHYGIEGEARWLSFALQPTGPGPAADEHAATYLIGPRYSRHYGRFQPYVKGLVGIGEFNFPYNLGTDSCFVAALGAGVDFRLTRRISWRAADVEYQFWPQFEYGQLKSYGVSSGIRIKIF
jgi:hypothetical protein